MKASRMAKKCTKAAKINWKNHRRSVGVPAKFARTV
jgi:hypothetical protein